MSTAKPDFTGTWRKKHTFYGPFFMMPKKAWSLFTFIVWERAVCKFFKTSHFVFVFFYAKKVQKVWNNMRECK